MSRLLIRIKWHHGTEFISLDPDQLPRPQTYLNTTEYWEEERETVKYTALCTSVARRGATVELEIEYAAAKNRALIGKNYAWGKSSIVLDIENVKASARWTDVQHEEYNGAGRCTVLEDELLDEYSYEQISRLKRPKQSAIRLQLLQMYNCCALTGETTRAVLDAAHIVAAADKGLNTKLNCFLLRTDLHRLFDRGLLTFTPEGKVCLTKEVGGQYVSAVSGRALSDDVLENVRPMLAKRFGNAAP